MISICSHFNKLLIALIGVLAIQAGQQPDPITDRMRYEIAAAQRDYVVAKVQMDAATRALTDAVSKAQKACGEKQFDAQQMACVEKK